jgi:hypothetical protein
MNTNEEAVAAVLAKYQSATTKYADQHARTS